MPIKPIDLQTLFTQLDRVGRERAAEKEGAALQQSIQSGLIKKRADEISHAVQGTQDAQDNTEQKVAIRDDSSAGSQGDGTAQEKQEPDDETDENETARDDVFRDPQRGGKLDILG